MSLTGNLFYKSLFVTIRSGLTGAGTQKDCEIHDLIQEVILGQRNTACLRIYSPQDFLFHHKITSLFFESTGNIERM